MMFSYRALKDGLQKKGSVEAATAADAAVALKNNGYFPIEITAVEVPLFSGFKKLFNRVSFGDTVHFTRQLSIMLEAGLTIIDALTILRKQTPKESVVAMIEDIDKQIRGGKSFSAAISKYPNVFSSIYVALVKAGEFSGKMNQILGKLADNLEKEREFRNKVRGALVYPAVIISAMIVVGFIMVTFVLPRLLELYKDFNIDLPFATRVLIVVSGFSSQFWPFIVGGTVGFVVLARNYMQTRAGKYVRDMLLLRIPVISRIIAMSNLVDATRTLSILIGSGVLILDALSIVADTTSNVIFQDAFRRIYKQVERGVGLGQAMQTEGIFPPILIQMAEVGEQTGQLDETFLRVALYFEIESDMAVKAMTTLIEPIILVLLGVAVGILVISVITPMYAITNSFQ